MKRVLLAAVMLTLVMLASLPQETGSTRVIRLIIRRPDGIIYCLCTPKCKCVKITKKSKTKRSVDSVANLAAGTPPRDVMSAAEAQRTLTQMTLTCPQDVSSLDVDAAFNAADGDKDRRLNRKEMNRFQKALRAYEVCAA